MVIFMLFVTWYDHALKALMSTKLLILSCHSWACTNVLIMELKALHAMSISTNRGRVERLNNNNSFSLKSVSLFCLNALVNWEKDIQRAVFILSTSIVQDF